MNQNMNINPNMMNQNMMNQDMMNQNMMNQNMMNQNMMNQNMMNQNMMNQNMMNNLMMQNMMMYNPMYPMMPNIGINPTILSQINDNSLNDPNGWNLKFEIPGDGKTYNIVIDRNKKLQEAINRFKLKSNMQEKCKFIFNNKELFPELEICQSGLQDGSKISVISLKDLKGA